MKVLNEGLSRLRLMVLVTSVMNIPDKTFRKWSKTSAPNFVTREGLLVDTIISNGFLQCEDFTKKDLQQIPFYKLETTSSVFMDGTSMYVVKRVDKPGIVATLRLKQADAEVLTKLFILQEEGIALTYPESVQVKKKEE